MDCECLDVIYENPSGQLLDITCYDVNSSRAYSETLHLVEDIVSS